MKRMAANIVPKLLNFEQKQRHHLGDVDDFQQRSRLALKAHNW